MKINKQFTIDIEIAEELSKEKNASSLINSLLSDYYSEGGKLAKQDIISKISLKEIESNKLLEETKQLKEKLQSIEKKEQQLKSIYKNVPDEVLDDFKAFPKMNETILIQRFKNIYSRKYKLKFEELKKAFNEYYKDE